MPARRGQVPIPPRAEELEPALSDDPDGARAGLGGPHPASFFVCRSAIQLPGQDAEGLVYYSFRTAHTRWKPETLAGGLHIRIQDADHIATLLHIA